MKSDSDGNSDSEFWSEGEEEELPEICEDFFLQVHSRQFRGLQGKKRVRDQSDDNAKQSYRLIDHI